MTLAPGSQLGPYRIISQLGAGGMGIVHLAHDPRLDRYVAIKLLASDLTRDETAKQRFLQEAKAASALDHINICTIHEINETGDGQLYLVMSRPPLPSPPQEKELPHSVGGTDLLRGMNSRIAHRCISFWI